MSMRKRVKKFFVSLHCFVRFLKISMNDLCCTSSCLPYICLKFSSKISIRNCIFSKIAKVLKHQSKKKTNHNEGKMLICRSVHNPTLVMFCKRGRIRCWKQDSHLDPTFFVESISFLGRWRTLRDSWSVWEKYSAQDQQYPGSYPKWELVQRETTHRFPERGILIHHWGNVSYTLEKRIMQIQ